MGEGEVTRLLAAWRDGEPDAMDRLMPLVYDELRRMAHFRLGRRRGDHTLNTTALVHEAYLKLGDPGGSHLQDRSHFMAVASIAMRQVLMDYARKRSTQKRGEGAEKVELDEQRLGHVDVRVEKLLALDQALDALAAVDPRQSRVVEMRFFTGLSLEEIAAVLGVTDRTVKRDWRTARAFLHHTLGGGPESP